MRDTASIAAWKMSGTASRLWAYLAKLVVIISRASLFPGGVWSMRSSMTVNLNYS